MSPEPTSSPPTMHTSSPNPNSLPPSPNVSSPSPPNEPDYSLNCFDRAARDEYNTWSIILELDDHSTPAVMLVTQDIRTRLEGILTLFPPLGGLLKLDTDGLPTLQYRQPPGSKLIDYEEEVFQQAIHDQLCGRLPDDLLERRFVPQLLYDKDLCLIPQTDLQTGKPPFTLKANFLRGETYHVFISFAVHRFLADNHTALLIISTLAGGWKIDIRRFQPRNLHPYVQSFPAKSFPEWNFDQSSPTTQTRDLISTLCTLTNDQVERLTYAINSHIGSRHEGRSISQLMTKECLAALCWAAIVRARLPRIGLEADVKLTTSVESRAKLQPELPQDYFGNMAVDVVATTKTGRLLGVPSWAYPNLLAPNDIDDHELPHQVPVHALASAAILIHNAMRKVSHEFVGRRLEALSLMRPEEVKQVPEASARAADMATSGIRFESLADHGADIQYSTMPHIKAPAFPLFCRKHAGSQEGMATILPRKGGELGDADWEIQICLRRPDSEILATDNMFRSLA